MRQKPGKISETTMILFLSLAACVSGCTPVKIAPIRIHYHKVNIPNYERTDYERLLNSKNKGVRYNAVCHLISHSDDYAEALGKKTGSEEDAEQLENAENVVKTIIAQLGEDDENLKSASLAFIGGISSLYPKRKELFEPVFHVRSEYVGTQYEHILALTKLAENKARIDPKLAARFLDSPSWIIRGMALKLLKQIPSESFHARLIDEYRKSENEFDKILIIETFGNGYGPDVFALLAEMQASNESRKIKKHWAGIVTKHRDKSAVVDWIMKNHPSMDDETLKTVVNSWHSEFENPEGKTFFEAVLRSGSERLVGSIDSEAFFEKLCDSKNLDELAGVRSALRDNRVLNGAWSEYKAQREREKEKSKREKELEKKVLPKYTALFENFVRETEKMCAAEGMTPEEIKELLEDLQFLLNMFKKERDSIR